MTTRSRHVRERTFRSWYCELPHRFGNSKVSFLFEMQKPSQPFASRPCNHLALQIMCHVYYNLVGEERPAMERCRFDNTTAAVIYAPNLPFEDTAFAVRLAGR